MSLKAELMRYRDYYGLVAPSPVEEQPSYQASDNGPMFTAEAVIMLNRQGDRHTAWTYLDRIYGCVDSNGLLNRATLRKEHLGIGTRQEGPDDYYGVLAACAEMGCTDLPLRFLSAVGRYRGALNNEAPGAWSWRSFLVRQPQLLCAMIAAAYPGKEIEDRAVRLVAFPLFVYTAAVIALSCRNTPRSDTDARRLSWLLIQTVRPVSLLCRLASKGWYKRLYRDFPDGMKDVAVLYYAPLHPFAHYWIA